jgi:L-ascorbate metabolism protein UlaG (beta-lactamase superfamily)
MVRTAPSRFRRVLRWFVVACGVGGVAVLLLLLVVTVSGYTAFGKRASGERRLRMEASPQYQDGVFENPQPMWNDPLGAMTSIAQASPVTVPDEPIPVEDVDARRFETPPTSGLRVTWLGHSTVLIEIDGVRILTDPIFGGRASPLTWAGPQAWYPTPLSADELPKLVAILISHDHHDHLQYSSIRKLVDVDTTWIVPLGVGAHLEYWGVRPARIVELDWWQEHPVGSVQLTCVPSRHASGRHLLDQMATLWAGYALVGPAHRVLFSGDTGLFPAMKSIGDKLGPFDVVMIEVGAYNRSWPDWHIGPEQALLAHEWLHGKVFLPIHWGLWSLATHGWTEPIERVLVEAKKRGSTVATPRPGQSFEPHALPVFEKWWPDVPWQTATEHPVVSTRVPGVSPINDPRLRD